MLESRSFAKFSMTSKSSRQIDKNADDWQLLSTSVIFHSKKFLAKEPSDSQQ